MSEETQSADPSTQADSADNGDSEMTLEQARRLVLDAGYNVMDSKALENRLAKERKKIESQFEDYPTLKEQYEDAQKRLKAIKDKDKSESQLLRERQQEWERINEENAQKLKDAEGRATAQLEANRAILRDVKLGQLLSNSADHELAHLAALKEFPSLTTDDEGNLVYTDKAGVEHVGDLAEERINSWWSRKTILHSAPHPGPPTRGGAKPGQSNASPLGDAPPENATHEERMDWARRKDAEVAAMRLARR